MPRERLIWAASAGLAVLIVSISFYIERRIVDTVLGRHRDYQLQAMSRVSEQFRNALHQASDDLLYLTRLSEVQNLQDARTRLALETYLSAARTRGIEELAVCDAEGKLVLRVSARSRDSRSDPCASLVPAEREWFAEPAHVGAVRARAVPESEAGLLLTLLTPAYEMNPPASPESTGTVRIKGALMAMVALEPLARRLLNSLCSTASSQALLIDGDRVLAASAEVLSGREIESVVADDISAVFRRQLRPDGDLREGFTVSEWQIGDRAQPAALAWWPLQIGDERWMLVAMMPQYELLASGEHRVHRFFAFVLAGVVLAVSAVLVRVHVSRQRLVKEVASEQERTREIGERAWQSALLGQIVEEIRGSMDTGSILETAARAGAAALGVSRCAFYFMDGRGSYRLHTQFVSEGAPALDPQDSLPPALVSPGDSATPLHVDDVEQHVDPDIKAMGQRWRVRAFALAAVPRGHRGAGVMVFHQCDAPRLWKESEARFIERLAAQVGTVMDQAELYAKQAEAAEVRSGLLQVAQALSSARETASVLDLAARVASPLTRCRRTFILVKDDGTERWRVRGHFGLEPGEVREVASWSIVPSMHLYLDEAVRRRSAVSIPSATEDWRVPPEYARRIGLESILVIPLLYGSEVMGLFLFERARAEGELSEAEIEVATVVSDLTASALKNAQLFEALQASEARYQDLYDQAPDMYQTFDIGGVILDCNRTQCRVLGYDKREIVGRSLAGFLTAGSVAIWNTALERVFGEGFVRDVHLQLVKKDGGAVQVSLNASLIETAVPAKPQAARAVLRDVTELKKLEQQLQQSQKLEVIGTLAGGVAHDFNNLLSGILGYASLLRSHLAHVPRAARYLETIERSALRGSELTAKLLTAARQKSSRSEPVDFNQLVDETLDLLDRTLHKNIRIEKRLERGLRPILGDTGQIQQVILNLCVNARDAMQKGGVLTVETEYLKEAGRLRLSVADTGIGMDPDTMERIFEPFFSTKGAAGTGLGLSVVYGIVNGHGGDVRVTSSPGKGARFDLFFPVRWAEEREPIAERRLPVRGEGELILLVDDEEVLRSLGQEILEGFGYRVVVAGTGDEAIELFERLHNKIALVILDLIMPGLDGAETLRRIRSRDPQVPVLISSGFSQDTTVQKLLQEGASGFVAKPYAMTDLTSAVSAALHEEETPPTIH